MRRLLFIFVLVGGFFLIGVGNVFGASCTDVCLPNDSNCLNGVADACRSQISQLAGEANTLSNQIASFNAQISLMTAKIAQTQNEINLLAGRIDQVQGSLADLTKAFSARAVETYEMARFESPVYFLLSGNLADAVSNFRYLEEAQNSDQNLLSRLTAAQTTYEASKAQSEALQKQLNQQQNDLNSQKAAKQTLLAQTQGSETSYQKLLAQAQAQLASLSNYAQSVGTNLIPHQDLSDGFGKYFNQRDANWGGVLINGQGNGCGGSNGSACTISLVGCLVSSYTMVVSHFGGNLTPADVAANSSNFWPGTAEFNSPGPDANGHSATDVSNPNLDDLRNDLNSGAVVIAGLSINGGPYPQHYSDHWVVLRSVDGDSFRINDPLYAGAMNVSLKDHYASWTIIQAKIYR